MDIEKVESAELHVKVQCEWIQNIDKFRGTGSKLQIMSSTVDNQFGIGVR